ncbi:(d)CMP kinase [Sessilibacter corallicola]|uniref:(d)CMP kinase n=1 Tax=Sessilibacter corallicola TaxID=2904075 RepID=UPI001E4B2AAE|nr:(d)CMP kinase [Sessilibacter corallicola]
MTYPVITIDGPSGAGKGTLSLLLAKQYGFHLLDSGAIYRLGALAAKLLDVNIEDESAVANICQYLDVEFEPTESGVAVILNGQDVSQSLRTEEIGMMASTIAAYPSVRETLVERQRSFARNPGLIADGRDMGTTIFPNANAKIFLTAGAEDRAKRRYNQLMEAGCEADYSQILADIEQRDLNDAGRAVSPLAPADDALLIDSSTMGIDEVCQTVVSHLQSLKII